MAAAGKSTVYNIDYELPLVNNKTEIALFAFSTDYTTGKLIKFTGLGKGVSWRSLLGIL